MINIYRPQRSWAKVMFLQASVILLMGGGCLPQCMLGYPHLPWSRHPPADTPHQSRHTPLEQTPPWSRHPPPGADTPQSRPFRSRHTPPWEYTPLEQTPPRPDIPRKADSGIRSMSERYASYWNAFLFEIVPFLFC